MRTLTKRNDYVEDLILAKSLNEKYDKPVIFHCWWKGNLNEKHLYSVMSCYYFNVFNNNNRIILWLDGNKPNNINTEIAKYCEVKQFSIKDEKEKSGFTKNYNYNFRSIPYLSDFVRLLLLYNYGGCWFDLDCFFLRSFEPLFYKFENDICLHGWEKRNFPGNGIVVSLKPESQKLKKLMEFIIKRNKGWGCKEAALTYNLDLDIVIFPSNWISPNWIKHKYNIGSGGVKNNIFFNTSAKRYNFENFFNGVFCYHWHNKWNVPIQANSIIKQLIEIIENNIKNNSTKDIYRSSLKNTESINITLENENQLLTSPNYLDFIEIGTSDFDTEIQKKDNKIGLSIDAVKYYIDKLPNKAGCTKINNGVSNFNGEITINYLSIENIKKYKLPNWVRGCNSVNHYHPTVTKLLLNKGIQIKDIALSYKVPCKTLLSLLKEYDVQGFYLLKVDTEGHDSVILEHFLKNNKSNNLLPHKIIFESNVLTNKKDTTNIIQISQKIGYDLISSGHDTILKLNLNKINKTFIFSSKIVNYYIEDYPTGYDRTNLPHENTLEGAKKYCLRYKCSGITYQYNRYEVRNGKYINYHKDPNLLSWILI